jgi:hypothetical protein
MGNLFTPKGSPRVAIFFFLLGQTPVFYDATGTMTEMYSISCNSLYILVFEAQYKIVEHNLPILLSTKASLELFLQSEQNLEPFVSKHYNKVYAEIVHTNRHCIVRLLAN